MAFNAIDILTRIISGPVEIAGRAYDTYVKAKTREDELADAKHQRNIELIRESGAAEAAWNQKSLDNSGWKDEYWTITLSIPLFAVFCPYLVPYVTTGFAVLQTLPAWYVSAVGLMIGSSFGYRRYTDFVMARAYRLPKKDGDASKA